MLQLENYFLTQLRMDFHFPANGKKQIQELKLDFDYDTLKHHKEPLRRLLRLRVSISERDSDDQKIGFDIECEINGQFLMPEDLEPGKQEGLLRVNGVSILYSTLRGILGNVTGSFPGERLCLPTVLPQKIVATIEERKQQAASTTKPPARTDDGSKKPVKKAPKKKAKNPTK